jgi:hypothetical protein
MVPTEGTGTNTSFMNLRAEILNTLKHMSTKIEASPAGFKYHFLPVLTNCKEYTPPTLGNA